MSTVIGFSGAASVQLLQCPLRCVGVRGRGPLPLAGTGEDMLEMLVVDHSELPSMSCDVCRQRGTRPLQVFLHSALGTTHHPCDLGKRKVIDVAQHDRVALRYRQCADTAPQRVVDRCRLPLRRFGGDTHAVDRGPFATATASLVRGSVQRNTAHPGARAVEPSDHIPPPESLEQCILRQLLGDTPTARPHREDRDEARELLDEERVERLCRGVIEHRHHPHTPQPDVRWTTSASASTPRGLL